ncbi:hypothetical protein V8E54_004834, partial [Elaphomyces granulatus]
MLPKCLHDSQIFMPTDVAKSDSTQALHTSKSTACTGYRVTTVEREWIVKRTGKRRIVDRDICCAYVDEKTGTKCDWKTTDSVTKTTRQRLEKNILRWVVTSKQPFTVVQDPDFKQIF